MGKSGSRGLPPSRRRGGSGDQSPRPPRDLALPSAASEIAVKMQQIAQHIEDFPVELAKAVNGERPNPQSQSTGVEVVDIGLLYRSSKSISADVVTLDAYPNPDRPEHLAVRLDGWEGSLLIHLTRDRAISLVNRLTAAIEKSTDWYGPAAK